MKTYITNRHGLKVCVNIENSGENNQLALVMHGLSGNKEQPHVRAMAEAFLENDYAVVTFDTTNTFGESEGNYEDATITNYYEDLEDVIGWASSQPWYSEPFVLCGHSLGGISTALYAESYPEKVRALAPISTVVSGKLSFEAYRLSPTMDDLEQWKKDGISITTSFDGKRVKRLKWSHMEDRLKYDLLSSVDKLTMPVLLVVGENDQSTPVLHQQMLFDALPDGRKQLHIIKGALHSFYEPAERVELKTIIDQWLKSLAKHK